jgi:hypothetical protein
VGRRRLTLAAVAAAIGLFALVAGGRPRQFVIDGLSMGPGLLPGDRVATGPWPLVDRWREPTRFERWIVAAPDGTPALKRVVGLPGEVVSIRDGDLSIDGRKLLAAPAILAEVATCLAADIAPPAPEPTFESGDDDALRWRVAVPEVLDDAAFAPRERRVLLPVRDIGLAAIVRLNQLPAETARLAARIGDRRIAWRLAAPGRYAVVAGRLDGHLVGAAWPLDVASATARGCLPPGGPEAWDVAVTWPGDEGPPQALELGLGPLDSDDAARCVERLIRWRDWLLRPAADQVEEWRLGADEYFLLGDFPSGSRDSRHWGPLGRESLRHRVLRRD